MTNPTDLIIFLDTAANVLAAILLALALMLVLTPNVQAMIRLYQGQSLVLAGIALITAIAHGQQEVILAMAPPLILALLIEYMLARATVLAHERRTQNSLRSQARSLWLRQGPARIAPLVGLIDLLVVMLTYTIAFAATSRTASIAVATGTSIDAFCLTIALGLLILGLFALGTQGHLIAQVMGLLVAEHGLFLAVVRLVRFTTLTVFIIGLLLYILLTLTILLVLLPNLRQTSASMQVTDQRELRG
jgi:hydrogenase-4 membrane subunit HyfE